MQLEFNTVTIILLTMLVIGIILAIGKFDYEKKIKFKIKVILIFYKIPVYL